MHVVLYGCVIAAEPQCDLTDGQRVCARHGPDDVSARWRENREQPLQRIKSDVFALRFAFIATTMCAFKRRGSRGGG